jgi:hypothetical protein
MTEFAALAALLIGVAAPLGLLGAWAWTMATEA